MEKQATYKVLDYDPFGSAMSSRSFSGASGYKFGFNGMLKESDIAEGNYTTPFRELDTRLGRWWSIDPLTSLFPWESPYVTFANNSIYFNDPTGLAPRNKWKLRGGGKNKNPHTKCRNPFKKTRGKVPRWTKIKNKRNKRGSRDRLNNNKIDESLGRKTFRPTFIPSLSQELLDLSTDLPKIELIPPVVLSQPLPSFNFSNGSPFIPNESVFENSIKANAIIKAAANAFIAGEGTRVQITINTPFTPGQLANPTPNNRLGGITANQLQWNRGWLIMNALIAHGVPRSAFGSNWLIINNSQFKDINLNGIKDKGEPINTNARIKIR